MTSVAVMGVEGVLAHPEAGTVSFGAQAPVQTGLRLFVALKSMFKVVLVTDEVDLEPVEYFLKRQTLDGHALLIGRKPWEEVLDHAQLRLKQLDVLKGQYAMPVTFVVDPDPTTIARVVHRGIVGSLFAHPTYQRPEFRPDNPRGLRAWDDIVEELESQKLLKGTDPRLMPEIGV